MEQLLQLLIKFFADGGVVPPEVKDDDTNREGTYLYELPTEPRNAVSFNLYGQLIPSGHKQFQLTHLQIVVRNRDSAVAAQMIQRIFDFATSLTDPEKDGIQEIDGNYFMFDVQNGPVRIGQDAHQNMLWSLSIPIKCRTAIGGVYG